MKSKLRLALPLLALPFLLRQPAAATTYMMMPDSALVDQAAAVVDVKVVDVSSAPLAGQPATDYLVEVNRVLKGNLSGSTVVVRVPGGVDPQGLGLKIWGAPQFGKDEEALLFLRPAKDGTYRILHLMLGAFHQRTVNGKTVALRDIKAEVELGFDPQLAFKEAQRCLNCDVQTVFTGSLCIECDACVDICPMDCITFTTNADEKELRQKLNAPGKNPTQDLYVSGELKTKRVMVKDEDVCLHCGLCAERCPTGAWDMQKFLVEMTQAGPACRSR